MSALKTSSLAPRCTECFETPTANPTRRTQTTSAVILKMVSAEISSFFDERTFRGFFTLRRAEISLTETCDWKRTFFIFGISMLVGPGSVSFVGLSFCSSSVVVLSLFSFPAVVLSASSFSAVILSASYTTSSAVLFDKTLSANCKRFFVRGCCGHFLMVQIA